MKGGHAHLIEKKNSDDGWFSDASGGQRSVRATPCNSESQNESQNAAENGPGYWIALGSVQLRADMRLGELKCAILFCWHHEFERSFELELFCWDIHRLVHDQNCQCLQRNVCIIWTWHGWQQISWENLHGHRYGVPDKHCNLTLKNKKINFAISPFLSLLSASVTDVPAANFLCNWSHLKPSSISQSTWRSWTNVKE